MTRSLRLVSGFLLAVLLSACAGRATGVDEAADAAAASTAGLDRGGSDTGSLDAGTTAAATTGQNGDTGYDGGLPGGPGGDPADAGGGGGEAQGNPGAPGDVAVFEERGVSYAEFREGSAQQVCVEQKKCTLAPPKDPEGVYSDPEQCPIEGMDYSTGTHPDAEGRTAFYEGAVVTVTVSCLRFTEPEGGGTEGDSSATSTSAGDQPQQ